MMTLRPPGLRQRKKDRLRDELHRAATDLFLERGFDRTTIDDIVAAVDVSRRTFFRYFDTKEDAWFYSPAVDLAVIEQFVRDRPPSESPHTSARLAYHTMMERYTREPVRGLAMARLASTTLALRAKLALFRERSSHAIGSALAERSGARPDDLAPYVIASGAVWTIAAAVDRWIAENGVRSLDTIIDDAFHSADALEFSAVGARR